MLLVHAGVLLALVGIEAFFTGLAVLDRRHEERRLAEEREWVEAELGVEDVSELRDYQRVTTGTSLLRSWVTLAGLLLVLYSGLFADAVAALRATGYSPLVQGVALVAGALLALRVAGVPFDLYETFVVEETFGFNNQGLALWLRDYLLGTAIALAIALPVAAGVLWFVGAVGPWWVAAWALVVGVLLLMQLLLPRVVFPLFYEFTPLSDGDLRDAVERVFEGSGFTTDEVYEIDASRRSSHTNAFFSGFGRAKRVVLFDTLVEGMTPEEVEAVLAHELAHWKKGHIWKFVALAAVEYLVVFAVLGALVDYAPLYAAFGVPEAATYAGLVLAAVVVGQVQRLTSPLSNLLSLRFERQADRYAVDHGGSEPMAGALAALAEENLAALFPHPWYETFHYDHPPIPERIRYVRAMGEDDDGAEDVGEGEGPGGTAPDRPTAP